MSQAVLRDVIATAFVGPRFAGLLAVEASVALEGAVLSMEEREILDDFRGRLARAGSGTRPVGPLETHLRGQLAAVEAGRPIPTRPSLASMDRGGSLGAVVAPQALWRLSGPPAAGQAALGPIAAGLGTGLRATAGGLRRAGEGLQQAGSTIGGDTGKFVSSTGERLVEAGGFVEGAADHLASGDVGGVIGVAIKFGGDLITALGNALNSRTLQNAGAAVSNAGQTVQDYAQVAGAVVSAAINTALTAVIDVAAAVGSAIAVAAGALADGIVATWNAIVAFFTGDTGQNAATAPATGTTTGTEGAPPASDTAPPTSSTQPEPPPQPEPDTADTADTGDQGSGVVGSTPAPPDPAAARTTSAAGSST